MEMKAVIATKPTRIQVTALFEIKDWQDSDVRGFAAATLKVRFYRGTFYSSLCSNYYLAC